MVFLEILYILPKLTEMKLKGLTKFHTRERGRVISLLTAALARKILDVKIHKIVDSEKVRLSMDKFEKVLDEYAIDIETNSSKVSDKEIDWDRVNDPKYIDELTQEGLLSPTKFNDGKRKDQRTWDEEDYEITESTRAVLDEATPEMREEILDSLPKKKHSMALQKRKRVERREVMLAHLVPDRVCWNCKALKLGRRSWIVVKGSTKNDLERRKHDLEALIAALKAQVELLKKFEPQSVTIYTLSRQVYVMTTKVRKIEGALKHKVICKGCYVSIVR